MRAGVYRRDVKKWVLILLDALFGIYFLNSKLLFFRAVSFGQTVDSLFTFLGGILLSLNFLYLILFSRRI